MPKVAVLDMTGKEVGSGTGPEIFDPVLDAV